MKRLGQQSGTGVGGGRKARGEDGKRGGAERLLRAHREAVTCKNTLTHTSRLSMLSSPLCVHKYTCVRADHGEGLARRRSTRMCQRGQVRGLVSLRSPPPLLPLVLNAASLCQILTCPPPPCLPDTLGCSEFWVVFFPSNSTNVTAEGKKKRASYQVTKDWGEKRLRKCTHIHFRATKTQKRQYLWSVFACRTQSFACVSRGRAEDTPK